MSAATGGRCREGLRGRVRPAAILCTAGGCATPPPACSPAEQPQAPTCGLDGLGQGLGVAHEQGTADIPHGASHCRRRRRRSAGRGRHAISAAKHAGSRVERRLGGGANFAAQIAGGGAVGFLSFAGASPARFQVAQGAQQARRPGSLGCGSGERDEEGAGGRSGAGRQRWRRRRSHGRLLSGGRGRGHGVFPLLGGAQQAEGEGEASKAQRATQRATHDGVLTNKGLQLEQRQVWAFACALPSQAALCLLRFHAASLRAPRQSSPTPHHLCAAVAAAPGTSSGALIATRCSSHCHRRCSFGINSIDAPDVEQRRRRHSACGAQPSRARSRHPGLHLPASPHPCGSKRLRCTTVWWGLLQVAPPQARVPRVLCLPPRRAAGGIPYMRVPPVWGHCAAKGAFLLEAPELRGAGEARWGVTAAGLVDAALPPHSLTSPPRNSLRLLFLFLGHAILPPPARTNRPPNSTWPRPARHRSSRHNAGRHVALRARGDPVGGRRGG